MAMSDRLENEITEYLLETQMEVQYMENILEQREQFNFDYGSELSIRIGDQLGWTDNSLYHDTLKKLTRKNVNDLFYFQNRLDYFKIRPDSNVVSKICHILKQGQWGSYQFIIRSFKLLEWFDGNKDKQSIYYKNKKLRVIKYMKGSEIVKIAIIRDRMINQKNYKKFIHNNIIPQTLCNNLMMVAPYQLEDQF